ncbi:hypothetical protein [Agrobacterium tumefaciens]|uniref:hypothetical protein n=1 Tax=Agrobacterium tumefaciens TaxID=358 RepID=UPI00277FA682|nr:hypothetical protein [Agrobacterium tumefaciens]MDP9857520.1 uncharacterized membrane protein HdeD (DUF308 family) [Agrobacterium tumefaciens]
MTEYRKRGWGRILRSCSGWQVSHARCVEWLTVPTLTAKALMCRPPHSGPAVSEAPGAGHRAGHALSRQRAPSLISWLHRLLDKGRDSGSRRFNQPSDWLRLVALGVVLIDFAILSLANRFIDRHFEGYLAGLGPILGGLLFAIIVLRLARPSIYPDWITIGLLQAAVGCIVSIDPELRSTGAFTVVCFLLLTLSGLRLWAGETLRPRRGAASLLAGGCTTPFIILWMIADRCFGLGTGPDMVLTADLLVAGSTIILFGLSLRTDKGPPVV